MMTLSILTVTIYTSLCSINSTNPVKTCIIMMLISSMIFTKMYWDTGNTLFFLIFFMLFTGGIMIMIMILSSLMPNESMKKSKFFLSISMTMFLLMMSTINSTSMMNESYKTPYSSSFLVSGLIIILFLYFLSFMCLLSAESRSMQFYSCCLNKIL